MLHTYMLHLRYVLRQRAKHKGTVLSAEKVEKECVFW